MNKDVEHLRLLSIGHSAAGALCAVCTCFPIAYLVAAIGVVTGNFDTPTGMPSVPESVGWVVIVLTSLFTLFSWVVSIGLVMAGRKIQRREGYGFCLGMAGVACLAVPVGTAIGAASIMILLRPSVKAMFDKGVIV